MADIASNKHVRRTILLLASHLHLFLFSSLSRCKPRRFLMRFTDVAPAPAHEKDGLALRDQEPVHFHHDCRKFLSMTAAMVVCLWVASSRALLGLIKVLWQGRFSQSHTNACFQSTRCYLQLSHTQALVLQQAIVSTFGSTTFTQVMRQVASKSQYRYSTALHEDCDVTHAQTSPLYHKVSPRRITIDALQARGWLNRALNSGSDTILRIKMQLSLRLEALGNTASGHPIMDLTDAIPPRTSPC
jgi:hypothetical protein